jgi:hypothetical protein
MKEQEEQVIDDNRHFSIEYTTLSLEVPSKSQLKRLQNL